MPSLNIVASSNPHYYRRHFSPFFAPSFYTQRLCGSSWQSGWTTWPLGDRQARFPAAASSHYDSTALPERSARQAVDATCLDQRSVLVPLLFWQRRHLEGCNGCLTCRTSGNNWGRPGPLRDAPREAYQSKGIAGIRRWHQIRFCYFQVCEGKGAVAMGPIYVEIRTLSPHSARETRRWRQEGQQCRCLCTEGSSGVPDRIVG